MLVFQDEEEKPRRKQGKCDQTDDCLNDVEYAIFKKVYHNTRVKREVGKNSIFRDKNTSEVWTVMTVSLRN